MPLPLDAICSVFLCVIFRPFKMGLISSLSLLAAAAKGKHQPKDQITEKREKNIIAERQTVKLAKQKMWRRV